MLANPALARAGLHAGVCARVARALDRRRLAAVALVTVLLSLGGLINPALLDFFSPAEIALAWIEHAAELAVIALGLLAAFAVFDETVPRNLPLRLPLLCLSLLACSLLLGVLLHAYYADGFQHLPPPLRILADSLRWGLPAVFLAAIADVHQRAVQASGAARAAETARAQLEQAESEQQLALLQAQIEPHFLFNMLGNVRRLYRTQPRAGADAIESLMRYLHTALPQLRSRRTSLGEEIAAVRAYLELFRLRMGTQLDFTIDVDPALYDVEFPPMLLITLVENAIKHGIEPAGGGHIAVRARRKHPVLEASVADNGVGFGAAAVSGTGVGLVNVRRQLLARYGSRAWLTLEANEPRGARASIAIPLDPQTSDGLIGSDPRAGIAGMLTGAPPAASDWREVKRTESFIEWLRAHRGAIGMSGLLAFAGPVAFFTGTLSVMRAPASVDLIRLGLWWALYGAALWALMLLAGFVCERATSDARRGVRATIWVAAASLVVAVVSVLTAGRTTILIEQGVVHSAVTAHLYAFLFTFTIVLLYFAHLRRSREHEEAAARLAGAQRVQRDARRRIVQSRLQEVQARIDPQLLFDMLDAMRRLYARDVGQGERFLDELIAFLRAALPRLRTASSSLLREVELARAYAGLVSLASASELSMRADVAQDVMHARFPPGILLPLLNNTLGTDVRPVILSATREGGRCSLVLTTAAAPSGAAVARVQSLLSELYGSSATLQLQNLGGATDVILKVPYELA